MTLLDPPTRGSSRNGRVPIVDYVPPKERAKRKAERRAAR